MCKDVVITSIEKAGKLEPLVADTADALEPTRDLPTIRQVDLIAKKVALGQPAIGDSALQLTGQLEVKRHGARTVHRTIDLADHTLNHERKLAVTSRTPQDGRRNG